MEYLELKNNKEKLQIKSRNKRGSFAFKQPYVRKELQLKTNDLSIQINKLNRTTRVILKKQGEER